MHPLTLIHRQGEVVDRGAVAHVDAAVDVDEILEGDPKGAVVIRSVIQLKFIHMMVSYMHARTHVYIHYACMHACMHKYIRACIPACINTAQLTRFPNPGIVPAFSCRESRPTPRHQ